MAIKAQKLAFPVLFAATPCLREVVLFCLFAPALQAVGEVIIALPASRPFIDCHDFVSALQCGKRISISRT